ncbi:unnamed protein product [Camellia sinensis]
MFFKVLQSIELVEIERHSSPLTCPLPSSTKQSHFPCSSCFDLASIFDSIRSNESISNLFYLRRPFRGSSKSHAGFGSERLPPFLRFVRISHLSLETDVLCCCVAVYSNELGTVVSFLFLLYMDIIFFWFCLYSSPEID